MKMHLPSLVLGGILVLGGAAADKHARAGLEAGKFLQTDTLPCWRTVAAQLMPPPEPERHNPSSLYCYSVPEDHYFVVTQASAPETGLIMLRRKDYEEAIVLPERMENGTRFVFDPGTKIWFGSLHGGTPIWLYGFLRPVNS